MLFWWKSIVADAAATVPWPRDRIDDAARHPCRAPRVRSRLGRRLPGPRL